MKTSGINALHRHIFTLCPWWFLNTTHKPGRANNNQSASFCLSCREPVPGAGGHHPDQAERTHRGPAQSRRHRQHHHAGGHSLRNELLHRTVDPPQEIQTHHQYLLRRFACSKSHTQNFLSTSKKHVYTLTSICIHIWAKSSTGRVWGRQGEKGPPCFGTAKMQDSEEYFCTFCSVVSLSLLLFQFLSHLQFLNDAVVRRGERVIRVWAEEFFSRQAPFNICALRYKHVACLERRKDELSVFFCMNVTFAAYLLPFRTESLFVTKQWQSSKRWPKKKLMSSQCCQVLFGAFW